MRSLPTLLTSAVLAVASLSVAPLSTSHGVAYADDRSEAKTHYQAGVKFYNAGDYRSAIREFGAAQQLVPADLNNYNLALCYDKLGDADPAVQYYRAYLDKQPNTDKRAEIEASISRLDAAQKSVAAKKADEAKRMAEEAKRADDAKKAEDAKRIAEEARVADEARKAEEARKAADAAKKPGVATAPGPDDVPPVSNGGSGVPGSGQVVSTGDAQLDRVQAIDINAIRDQRVGGASSGLADTRTGPGGATPPNGQTPPNPQIGQQNPNGQYGQQTANNQPNQYGGTPNAPVQGNEQPQQKADPVYKKWWFWAIVAVSAYVVYEIATEDSSSDSTGRTMLPQGNAAAQPGGATLFRF